jgi:hypothetical protein
VKFLKKETMEYLRGERNAVKDEFVIGRERAGNSELVFVSLPESEKPLYALWNSKKAAKDYKKSENAGEVTFERITPKGSGGKESYVMLMPFAIVELKNKNISLDSAGAIFKLADCIEWNTGRIYHKRDGKSMTREMILKSLGIGNMKMKTILRELKKLDVIYYDNKKHSYFVNRKFIRKGAVSDED